MPRSSAADLVVVKNSSDKLDTVDRQFVACPKQASIMLTNSPGLLLLLFNYWNLYGLSMQMAPGNL